MLRLALARQGDREAGVLRLVPRLAMEKRSAMSGDPAHRARHLDVVRDSVQCPLCGAIYDASYTVCLADGSRLEVPTSPPSHRRLLVSALVLGSGLGALILSLLLWQWTQPVPLPVDRSPVAQEDEPDRPAPVGMAVPSSEPVPTRETHADTPVRSGSLERPPTPGPVPAAPRRPRRRDAPSVKAAEAPPVEPEALGVQKSDLKDPFGAQ